MNEILSYERLLEIFKEIAKIPRDSAKEEKIASFICDFAKNLGLEYSIDDYYNVIVKKPASTGMENKKRLIFQGHLDMVCEKTVDSKHDFEKDPIEIIQNHNTLTAKDTTLGADDGIGLSTLLLLMESKEKLPLTYFVFTTQEEIGMDGAKNIDLSSIEADYLINLDSEEENSIIIGCAGGITLTFEKDNGLTDTTSAYELNIFGLKGGHSGVDIDKDRANANYLGATILSKFSDLSLISFNGGTRTNAIPNNAKIVFSTNQTNIEEEINKIIKSIKFSPDDNVSITINKLTGNFKRVSKEDSSDILSLILNLKQGVIDKKETVITSGNIAIVNLKEGKTTIYESLRSNISKDLENTKNINISIANKYGFSTSYSECYPGWDCNYSSKLLEKYKEAYCKTHKKEPIICAIHAGLECGILKEKLGDVEIISIGPDLIDVHTPDETLDLDSCKRLLDTLSEFIINI